MTNQIKTTFKIFIVLFLSGSFLPLFSQQKDLSFHMGVIGGYISPKKIPFWLRSNKFGSIPLDDLSLSLTGSVHKDYTKGKDYITDWGASFTARANIGNVSNFNVVEGYAKVRVSVFELRAGRSKELMGLCDTSLTSGAFAVSGTSLGIPKIQVGIPDFYTLQVFGRLFAFKGGYSHGWIGDIPMKHADSTLPVRTYFHQKWLYGRFGKPEWNLKLYGGFSHQVFWGNERKYYGDIFTLSPMKTYLYVITGTPYGNSEIARSKVGNHLGSIDIGFEYRIRDIKLFIYRQNIYDVGALYYLANIRDGLNGISIENMKLKDSGFRFGKLLFEFLYTKNQAGEFWSPVTPSGDEDYYNNYQYAQGWSYLGIPIGNPFIGSRDYIREKLPVDPGDYFINNRVAAYHIGFEGSLQKWDFTAKVSYSRNWGTYATSVEGRSLGTDRYPPLYGIFPETEQISAYLDAVREINNGIFLGITGAVDHGELYDNSFGMLFRLSKSF